MTQASVGSLVFVWLWGSGTGLERMAAVVSLVVCLALTEVTVVLQGLCQVVLLVLFQQQTRQTDF